MYFVAILIVLALMQYKRDIFERLQDDSWFDKLCQQLHLAMPGSNASMLVAVLLPCAVLWLFLLLLGDSLWGLTGLAACVLVLIYAFGRGDFSSRFEQYSQAWQNSEPEKIPAILQAIDPQYAPHVQADLPELHIAARRIFIYGAFTRLFVVLFWFALAGPVAALLYRLLRLYNREAEQQLASLLIAVMEWPVVRVFGISAALLGNFSSALGVWTATALNAGLSARRILCEVSLAALDLDMLWQDDGYISRHSPQQLAAQAREETIAIERLVKRCLVFAVVGIAIVHIVI